MPGELRVDTAPLASGGQGLLSAAGDIPLPPVPFTAAGGDALSTILNARTQAIEAPLIAGMPVTKAEALRTAQNIMQAAGIYERVDQQMADQILKALFGIDGTEGAGAAGSRWRWRRGCGRCGWRTGECCNGGRDSGGRGGAAGGSDGPDDGHADADGIASCPDTNAIGGHGGVDSAGNHAGSPERDAAGRPNGRRRRGKAIRSWINRKTAHRTRRNTPNPRRRDRRRRLSRRLLPMVPRGRPTRNGHRRPRSRRRMFRSSRTGRPRRARRCPDRKVFCDMSFRAAKACR